MWKINDAHHWIIKPHTRYECRSALRVREPRQSALLIDYKYYNHETNKFNLDKIKTINSYALHEIIDDCVHNAMRYPSRHSSFDYDNYENEYEDDNILSRICNLPIFKPKDNNFNME